MNQHEIEPRPFALQNARFLKSDQIWLALDDSLLESRRLGQVPNTVRHERISLPESEFYHRQLFYWLLIRKGPCFFSEGAPLHEGVPIPLKAQN